MESVTQAQRDLRERRSIGLREFVDQSVPALVEFARLLNMQPPEKILTDPDEAALIIERFLQHENLSDLNQKDRAWLHARLMYFIGHIFIVRHKGIWHMNDTPDSEYFLRYVIGRLGTGNPAFVIDPFSAVDDFLKRPPERKFTELLIGLEAAIRSAK